MLSSDQLQEKINDLAVDLHVPPDSYLLGQIEFEDTEKIKLCIDGLTLAFISYCYHKHPRGENVYEVMQELEEHPEGSPQARLLEERAETAAALEIPFIVKFNGILEDYYCVRKELEQFLADLEDLPN